MDKARHLKVGVLGETIATKYLIDKGFTILSRNYRKKWGELDIVASKEGLVHFVEVKSHTVSYDLKKGSSNNVLYRPEENVHPWKQRRLHRAIQSYLLEMKHDESEWQFDVIVVRMNHELKQAKVEVLWNVILEG